MGDIRIFCLHFPPLQTVHLRSSRLLSPVAAVQGLGGHSLLLDEQIDQGLHGLHLLVGHKLVVLGNGHKVHKAHVEDVVLVNVPEGVEPVGMVQVSIASEHLLHNALAVLVECLREPTGLANPLICGGSICSRWGTSLRRCAGGSWRRGSSGISHGRGLGDPVDLLSGEHDGIVNLADNPLLHAIDEFGGRDFGSTTIDEPGVG